MASNYFNNKRGVTPQDQTNFNMYSQEDQDALNGNTGQPKQGGFKVNYGAVGSSAGVGAANIYSTYQNPNSTGNDKYEATQSGIGNTVGSINPVIGGIMGVGNSIGKPIKANSEQFDSQGNLLNENKARRNAIGGALFDPIKAFSYRKASGNWGDVSGKGYTNWLENNEKSRLKGLQPEQPTYEDIQKMAYGGIGQPNSEVELQENSIAPDGEFTQYDGNSHSNGGIKTNLENGEMVFSDRLKLGKKTFAQLNKQNNTNKEDKILESSKDSLAKKTAELLKMAKLKNSQSLFQQQEDLKQSKVVNYAKRMGVDLGSNNEQQEQFSRGGMYKYPDGGRVNPNNLTYPQKLQAYSDSLNLYNSGQRPGQPNWKWPGANDSAIRLNNLNGVMPTPVGKTQVYSNDGSNNSIVTQSEQFKKPIKPIQSTQPVSYNQKPTIIPQVQATQPIVQQPIIQPQSNTVTQQPVVNTTPQVQNYSKRQWDFSNPSMKTLNYYDGAGKVINTENYDFNNKPIKTQQIQGFAKGGTYNPDIVSQDNPQDYNMYNQDSYTDPNVQEPKTNEFGNKFGNMTTQFGLGIANNAGNIYDLARTNKAEVTKYDRVKANLVDPTSAIRDIDHQNRLAEYDTRSASGGNAGSYLANRIALATNSALNKDRARQQYSNINAQIQNQNSSENAQIQRIETDANAMNRAQTRNIKGQAIANIGSNVVNQYRDNKQSQYDDTTLNNLNQLYSALDNDPVLKARWTKLRQGYK